MEAKVRFDLSEWNDWQWGTSSNGRNATVAYRFGNRYLYLEIHNIILDKHALETGCEHRFI